MDDNSIEATELIQCQQQIATLKAELAQLQAERDRMVAFVQANQALECSLNQLAGDRNLDAFLGYVLREALKLLNGACAQIFLFDAISNLMTASIGVDREGNVLIAPGLTKGTPVEIPFSADITGAWNRIVSDRKPLYFDLEQDAIDFYPGLIQFHREQKHNGSICVALMIGDRPLGFLGIAIQNRTEYSTWEFEFFQVLAQQATLAIHLTQLAEEAKQSAILKERNRIARELHDSLAHSLTGILMQLDVAKQCLKAEPEETQASMIRAQNLARQGLIEARRFVGLLYDDALMNHGLPNSLAYLIEQMSAATSTQITVSIEGQPYNLETTIDLNLLRIAQESLTNALRHAQAQVIQLQLSYTAQYIQLQISDDGCGFDLQDSKRGFGLLGMHDRAKEINAQLQIDSKLGKGTRITVSVESGEACSH